jgi:hypothetical protein
MCAGSQRDLGRCAVPTQGRRDRSWERDTVPASQPPLFWAQASETRPSKECERVRAIVTPKEGTDAIASLS